MPTVKQSRRPAFWAEKSMTSLLLWPLTLLFRLLATLRRAAFKAGWIETWHSPVPVIIIGNISVGGAGKTPLVIALCELLTDKGANVGIVARGYGGKADFPLDVSAQSDPAVVGDEPVLIAKRTGLPVVVCKSRVAAVKHLIANHKPDIVLSDDGLQHYALKRDIEIAVVDPVYRYGNGFCLPAGPLREPVSRLDSVDFTVYSATATIETEELRRGYTLTGHMVVDICDETSKRSLQSFSGSTVHAVAGIASPAKFFNYLRGFGIEIVEHSFADHAAFNHEDMQFGDDIPVIMTEKDQVKCQKFDLHNTWYLPVSAVLEESLEQDILSSLLGLIAERNSNAS